MTTQPHAIPSKQDELYDIAAVHADDFREFASGHDIRPECGSGICDKDATHVVTHGPCVSGFVCDEHAGNVRRFVAISEWIFCRHCRNHSVPAADVKVVPL